MSIIQEALKKVQKGRQDFKTHEKSLPETNPGLSAFLKKVDAASKKSMRKKISGPIAVITVTIIIFLLGAVAMTQFIPSKNISKDNIMTAVPAPAKPQQELTYKPISNIIAKSFKDTIPDAAPADEDKKAESQNFILNGIMYIKEAPKAIINNTIVGVGDMIKDAKILRITRRSVALLFKDTEILLNLK